MRGKLPAAAAQLDLGDEGGRRGKRRSRGEGRLGAEATGGRVQWLWRVAALGRGRTRDSNGVQASLFRKLDEGIFANSKFMKPKPFH